MAGKPSPPQRHLTDPVAAPAPSNGPYGPRLYGPATYPPLALRVRSFAKGERTVRYAPPFDALRRLRLREVFASGSLRLRPDRPRRVLRLSRPCEVRAKERTQTLRIDAKLVREFLRRNGLDFVRHSITSVRFHTRSVTQANVRAIVRSAYLRWVLDLQTYVRVRSFTFAIVALCNRMRTQSFERSIVARYNDHPPLWGRMGELDFGSKTASDL
jgi:hypothetical protein